MPAITYINDENAIRELLTRRINGYGHTKVQSIINEFVESDSPAATIDWEALGYPNVKCCVSVFNASIKRFGKNNVACRQRRGSAYLVRKDRVPYLFNKKEEEK